MVEAFIKIRLIQFYRSIRDVGLLRIIFLIGLFSYIEFILFIETAMLPNAYYISGFYVLIIAFIQVNRRDKKFLKSHFNNYKLIYLVEYLLLSIPLITSLIYHLQWITVILLILAISSVISLDLKPKQRSLNSRFQQLIPDNSFEWKAGIRKTLFFILPIWIIGLVTSFFIGSVPIVIFILGIITLSFYEICEPFHLILAFEMDANQFLFHKIKMQIKLFSILSIPLIAGFMIFHYDLWYIPLVEYLIFLSLQTYVILTKYAFYSPNNKPAAAQTFVAIGAIGTIIPVFIPVVWLLTIRFYFKSLENLNFYLNDYNQKP